MTKKIIRTTDHKTGKIHKTEITKYGDTTEVKKSEITLDPILSTEFFGKEEVKSHKSYKTTKE